MQQTIEINSNPEVWSNTLSSGIFHQLEDSFKPERFIHSCPDSYYLPKEICVFNLYCGEYARCTSPKTKFVKALNKDKNGLFKLTGNKKFTSYENYGDELEVMVPTYEHTLSSREFEDYAHKAIKRLKDKPNFWAAIIIRTINPFLDYIEVGIAIGHD